VKDAYSNILRNARDVQAVEGCFCSKNGPAFDAQIELHFNEILTRECSDRFDRVNDFHI
jgi:hypothetical protein